MTVRPENEILPVLWQDNYFALLPGETRQVTATYRTGDASKGDSKRRSRRMECQFARLLMFSNAAINRRNHARIYPEKYKDQSNELSSHLSKHTARTWTRFLRVLQDTPAIDREYMAPREEFQARVRRTNQALQQHGHTVGLVFSDEHYAGDVPYLGGNTNISIEQVAGIIGPNGFHVVAGLEGGYVAEQLADRAGATVHKVELLQLADEKYPIRAERLEDVIKAAAGKDVDHIALLTPRQVIPAGLVEYLQKIYGRRASSMPRNFTSA